MLTSEWQEEHSGMTEIFYAFFVVIVAGVIWYTFGKSHRNTT